MFSYNICTEADQDVFNKQCRALEKCIPSIMKADLLEDIDGSQTQIYFFKGKKISVHNSIYIDAVYVDSEIELENFFKQ